MWSYQSVPPGHTYTTSTTATSTGPHTVNPVLRPAHVHPGEPDMTCHCEWPPDWSGLRHYHTTDIHDQPCTCQPGPQVAQSVAFSAHGDSFANHERWQHIKPAMKNRVGRKDDLHRTAQTLTNKSPRYASDDPMIWLRDEVDRVCALGRL